MSATAAPFGLQPVFHPSGEIRLSSRVDGVLSTYGTSIFTGTPIKNDTNGTLIPTTTAAANPTIGVFMGCQFSSGGRRFVLPYWPASQAYDAGSCVVQYTEDPQTIYAGQGTGSYAATAVGEGVNLQDASQGSTYTGLSTQSLSAATGATAATFTIVGLAEYPNNAWGDAYTIVNVKIQTYQGPVA
ncbi:MAG: hypothetical protein ACOY4R_27765 [Pseudomonadota bacterium]